MLPAVNGEFRLAADPELRFTPSGLAVCSMRAVASSRKKQEDGNWVDDKTCWVNLTAFKRLAENAAESFAKGDLVILAGRLQTDTWETKEGENRTSFNILLDTIGHSTAFNVSRSVKTERENRSPSDTAAEDPWVTSGSTAADEPPPF